MDLRSLNSGSSESKGWLNPVCGTLTAGTVESGSSKTRDPATNLLYPNVSTTYMYYNAGVAAASVDVAGQFITAGRSSTEVPASAFVPGALYEYFFAGSFQDTTPGTTSTLVLSLTFDTVLPTAPGDTFCTALISSTQATDTIQMFHTRTTFLVTASSNTTITLSQSTCSSINGTATAVVLNESSSNVINTPNRTTTPTWSPRPVVAAVGGPVTLAVYNWYLRRIA